jgi:hypothetical protein
MILLDKNKTASTIIVTLLRSDSSEYVLVLKSPYTNKTYEVSLGTNQSEHIERYDEFELSREQYQDFEAGRYSYQIYEVVEGEKVRLAEVGVCTITESSELVDETIILASEETNDDIIVFQN